MTEKEKMLSGLYHLPPDPQLQQDHMKAQKLLHRYNLLEPDQKEEFQSILSQLLGKMGKSPCFKQPFRCDYGFNIEVGDYFFANYNCTILDSGKVKIGNEVMFGPNVGIYTVSHPLDFESRQKAYEIAKPIVIEDGVWLASNVVVLPGVTIGKRSVIGAGSVVTKDIPADSFAAGNPCKVIRQINQEEHIRL